MIPPEYNPVKRPKWRVMALMMFISMLSVIVVLWLDLPLLILAGVAVALLANSINNSEPIRFYSVILIRDSLVINFLYPVIHIAYGMVLGGGAWFLASS